LILNLYYFFFPFSFKAAVLLLKQLPIYKNLQRNWKTVHRLHLQWKRMTSLDSLKKNQSGSSQYLRTFDNFIGKKTPSLNINRHISIVQKKSVRENTAWKRD